MVIVEEQLRQLSQSKSAVNEYFNCEFELELKHLNKITNSRVVITEGEFQKYEKSLLNFELYNSHG